MINTSRLEESDKGRWVRGSYIVGDAKREVYGVLVSWWDSLIFIRPHPSAPVISAYASNCDLVSNGSGDLSTDERNPEITYSEFNADGTLTVYAHDQHDKLVVRVYQPLGEWRDDDLGEITSPQEGDNDEQG
jgi:hypothetical protein